jgi:hypothetical protein
MWSADKTNQERLVDQLSTMEERPHENPVLVANGIMQYKWFRPNKSEQEGVNQGTIQLKAHMAVEDGKDCDLLVGQVMDKGAPTSHTTICPISSRSPERTTRILTTI